MYVFRIDDDIKQTIMTQERIIYLYMGIHLYY